jgi:hypothetical protein
MTVSARRAALSCVSMAHLCLSLMSREKVKLMIGLDLLSRNQDGTLKVGHMTHVWYQ